MSKIKVYMIDGVYNDTVSIINLSEDEKTSEMSIEKVFSPMGKVKIEKGMYVLWTEDDWLIPLQLYPPIKYNDIISNNKSLIDLIEKFLDVLDTFLSGTLPPLQTLIASAGTVGTGNALVIDPVSSANIIADITNATTKLKTTLKQYKGDPL